jgi:hypothetical protein
MIALAEILVPSVPLLVKKYHQGPIHKEHTLKTYSLPTR